MSKLCINASVIFSTAWLVNGVVEFFKFNTICRLNALVMRLSFAIMDKIAFPTSSTFEVMYFAYSSETMEAMGSLR